MTNDFKYDVAFSLLDEDKLMAQAIEELLASELNCFLYATRQEELPGLDGLEAFSAPFRSESQLCVILYRDGYGATQWTRLEQNAIKDRWLNEGPGFLLVVSMAPDAGSGAPEWLSKWENWAQFSDLGPNGIARVIERKLREASGEARPVRVTSETATREALPRSFYQTQRCERYTESWEPTDWEVCDGCRSAVRFRPIARVTSVLGDWRATEQFCAQCARDRGIGVIRLPGGLSEEQIFARDNPSVEEHINRLLNEPGVFDGVAADKRLVDRGVLGMGAVIAHNAVAPIIDVEGRSLEAPEVPFSTLEEAGALTVPAVIEYLADHVTGCLDEPDRSSLRDFPGDSFRPR